MIVLRGMEYRKIDKYCIRCNRYSITKDFVQGVPKYSAWYGKTPLGVVKTSKDAGDLVYDHARRSRTSST